MLIYPSLREMVYFYQVPSGGLLIEAEVFRLPDRGSLDAPAFYDVLDRSVTIHRNADEFSTGLRYTVKDTDKVRFRISFFTYVWKFVEILSGLFFDGLLILRTKRRYGIPLFL